MNNNLLVLLLLVLATILVARISRESMDVNSNCQAERVLQNEVCILQPDAAACQAANAALAECIARSQQAQFQQPLETMDMNSGFDPAICEIDPSQPGCPPQQ